MVLQQMGSCSNFNTIEELIKISTIRKIAKLLLVILFKSKLWQRQNNEFSGTWRMPSRKSSKMKSIKLATIKVVLSSCQENKYNILAQYHNTNTQIYLWTSLGYYSLFQCNTSKCLLALFNICKKRRTLNPAVYTDNIF